MNLLFRLEWVIIVKDAGSYERIIVEYHRCILWEEQNE